jgi:hypothetical protein
MQSRPTQPSIPAKPIKPATGISKFINKPNPQTSKAPLSISKQPAGPAKKTSKPTNSIAQSHISGQASKPEDTAKLDEYDQMIFN